MDATAKTKQDLDKSFVRGLAWTGVGRWSTQLVTWAATLVVARILSPSDYGIFSMATMYLGLLTIVTEFGLGSAVITIRHLTNRQISQLNTLSVILGLIGYAITCIAAYPLSRFFHSPQLPPVLMIMGLGFVITSFQSVPQSSLQRDLHFRFLAFIDFVRALSTSAFMVALAFLGARYWTLVYGSLFGNCLAAILVLSKRRYGFSLPQKTEIHAALKFSWQVLVSRMSWYGYSNSDFLVAGRILGQTALGYYSLAWNLATLPIAKITSLIGSVTPGIYSAAQSDKDALRRYVLKPTEAISLVLFPVMAGVALVARDAVPVVLGAKWTNAILALQLLSVYACVRSVMPFLSQVLTVTGDAGFVMWTNLASVVIFPIVFVYATHWGAAGIAAAWIFVYPVNAVPIFLRVKSRLDLRALDYLKATWPGVQGILFMTVSVLLAHPLFQTARPIVRLGCEVGLGAAVYCASVLLFHRKRLSLFTSALRLARK